MPLTYKQIQNILNDYNFVLKRSSGSHFRYENNGYGITIPFHKEFAIKTARSILLTDISKIGGIEYNKLIEKYNIKI